MGLNETKCKFCVTSFMETKAVLEMGVTDASSEATDRIVSSKERPKRTMPLFSPVPLKTKKLVPTYPIYFKHR